MSSQRQRQFDVPAFKHAVDVTITAQEILVEKASYRRQRSRKTRTSSVRGLGYANLGALLMSHGTAIYDSEEGRDMSGAITR